MNLDVRLLYRWHWFHGDRQRAIKEGAEAHKADKWELVEVRCCKPLSLNRNSRTLQAHRVASHAHSRNCTSLKSFERARKSSSICRSAKMNLVGWCTHRNGWCRGDSTLRRWNLCDTLGGKPEKVLTATNKSKEARWLKGRHCVYRESSRESKGHSRGGESTREEFAQSTLVFA